MEKIKEEILLFSQKYKDRNIGVYSSSAAFFLFLSIVPFMVLLFSLVPYTPLTQDGVLEFLSDILPSSVNSFTSSIVAEVYGKQPALLSISAVLMLWSAGKGMQAITSGLNAINGYKSGRSFVVVRLEACLYTVVFIIMLMLTIFVFVFGKVILNTFFSKIIDTDSVLHALFSYRYLIECVLYTLLFSVMYAWVPFRRTNPKKQMAGAALAAVSWTVFSWVFSIYLENFNAYSMYGSLTTVIILMVWFYSSMRIMMVGALINVYKQPDLVEPPKTLLSVKRFKTLKRNKSKEEG